MAHTVNCIKLGHEAEGLDYPPYPGPLGEKIFHQISKEAWKQWQAHQTILINEYRLNMLDPQAKTFLQQEMEKFLFGDGSDLPEEFVEPEK